MLVVDDNAVNRLVANRMLAKLGCEVIEAMKCGHVRFPKHRGIAAILPVGENGKRDRASAAE